MVLSPRRWRQNPEPFGKASDSWRYGSRSPVAVTMMFGARASNSSGAISRSSAALWTRISVAEIAAARTLVLVGSRRPIDRPTSISSSRKLGFMRIGLICSEFVIFVDASHALMGLRGHFYINTR
ncbi:hypothetical protein ACFOHY_24280 [Rhizobium rosettiformans]|uniref:hypothetical protein n=1 Tax=Rhizobium rosettiformans TaxID=1368430 RepID=UPI00361AFAA7